MPRELFPPYGRPTATGNPFNPLRVADFTWVNQGGASADDLGGFLGNVISLRAPPTGAPSIRALVVSAPSTPWTLVAGLQCLSIRDSVGGANPILGLILRESSTGKLIDFGINSQSGASQRFGINYWTDEDTFSGTTPFVCTNPIFHNDLLWLKIEDNNTNLIFSIGVGVGRAACVEDYVRWVEVASLSRTAHTSSGPDQIGIAANNGSNASAFDSLLHLVYWYIE